MSLGLPEMLLIVLILAIPLALIVLLVRWLQRGAEASRLRELEQTEPKNKG